MKIKILWVSARIFDDNEEKQSGVWQKSLALKLALSDKIELASVARKQNITDLFRCDYKNIKQWALPFDKPNKNGYPSKKTEELFNKIVSEFKPDIIQIWGSENFLKLLPFENKFQGIKVLAIQGVLSSISPFFLTGMNLREIYSTIGIRELIFRRNVLTERNSFIQEGELEKLMIQKSDFIITQSEWTDSQLLSINPTIKLYRIRRELRSGFIECEKWFNFDHSKPVIYSASIGYPLKGLHILIIALHIIKRKFPDVELRLAGNYGRTDFLGDGYLRFIKRLIKKFDLNNNVKFLGALTSKEIVNELQNAAVFVNPSSIESYSLTLAEAMSVGTPSVVSFAGAMPELAENNKEALFFTPGDYKRCAYLIEKLLTDRDLALEISRNAVKRADQRNLNFDNVANHLNIYQDILINSKTAYQL